MSNTAENYSKREVAEMYKVTLGTVNNWIKRGLKTIKIGGTIRIRSEDLEAFVEEVG